MSKYPSLKTWTGKKDMFFHKSKEFLVYTLNNKIFVVNPTSKRILSQFSLVGLPKKFMIENEFIYQLIDNKILVFSVFKPSEMIFTFEMDDNFLIFQTGNTSLVKYKLFDYRVNKKIENFYLKHNTLYFIVKNIIVLFDMMNLEYKTICLKKIFQAVRFKNKPKLILVHKDIFFIKIDDLVYAINTEGKKLNIPIVNNVFKNSQGILIGTSTDKMYMDIIDGVSPSQKIPFHERFVEFDNKFLYKQGKNLYTGKNKLLFKNIDEFHTSQNKLLTVRITPLFYHIIVYNNEFEKVSELKLTHQTFIYDKDQKKFNMMDIKFNLNILYYKIFTKNHHIPFISDDDCLENLMTFNDIYQYFERDKESKQQIKELLDSKYFLNGVYFLESKNRQKIHNLYTFNEKTFFLNEYKDYIKILNKMYTDNEKNNIQVKGINLNKEICHKYNQEWGKETLEAYKQYCYFTIIRPSLLEKKIIQPLILENNILFLNWWLKNKNE